MTQKLRVLAYLEKYGSITSIESYEKLQIVDLQKAIQLLRKENYKITDKWIHKVNSLGKKLNLRNIRWRCRNGRNKRIS